MEAEKNKILNDYVGEKVQIHRKNIRENLEAIASGQEKKFNHYFIKQTMSNGKTPEIVTPFNQGAYMKAFIDVKYGKGDFAGVCAVLTDNFLASPRGGEAMMMQRLTQPEMVDKLRNDQKRFTQDFQYATKRAGLSGQNLILNHYAKQHIQHGVSNENKKMGTPIDSQPISLSSPHNLAAKLKYHSSNAIDIKTIFNFPDGAHAVGGRISQKPDGQYEVVAFDPNYGVFRTNASNKEKALDDLQKMFKDFSGQYGKEGQVRIRAYTFHANNDDRVESNIMSDQYAVERFEVRKKRRTQNSDSMNYANNFSEKY
ncbi:MAG: YopT-type cysteine protease domain-containing protein [Pseudomonadota bacterium]